MLRVHGTAELLAQLTPFRNSPRPGYALWLGAGASKRSGVPLASELIDEALTDFYAAHHPPPLSEPRADTAARARLWAEGLDWLRDRAKSRYALVMDNAFLSPGAREQFLKQQVLQSGVSLGYRRLAQLLAAKAFDTVFTTNFDHLVRRGCEGLLSQPLKEIISLEQYPREQPSPSEPRLVRMHGDFYHGNILNSEGELETLPMVRVATAVRLLHCQGLIVIGYGGNDRRLMSELFHRNFDNPDFLRNGLLWCVLPGQQPSHHVETLVDRDYPVPRISVIEIVGFDELLDAIARHFGIPDTEPDWVRQLAFSWSFHGLNRRLLDLIYADHVGSDSWHELNGLFGGLTRYLKRGESALIRNTGEWRVIGAKDFLRTGDVADLSGPAWQPVLASEHKYMTIPNNVAARDPLLRVLHPARKIEALPVWRGGGLEMVVVFASDALLDYDSDEFAIARSSIMLFNLAAARLARPS